MKPVTRVIVIEGCEGSGKTTLAKELEQLGWGYVHFKYETHEYLPGYWTEEIEKAAQKTQDGRVVVDRLHISCETYGRLLRGNNGLPPFSSWVMNGWLYARGASVVYVPIRDYNYSNDRVMARFQDLVSADMIHTKFKDRLNKCPLPQYRLRVGDNDWRMAKQLDDTHPPLEVLDDGGMGNLRPLVWFVADRRNPRWKPHGIRAATFDRPKQSSEYLYRALRVSGLNWAHMHISNAFDDNGKPRDLRKKYRYLKYPVTVILGKEAQKECMAQGLEHPTVLDHPQYVRRFKHSDILSYARQLRDAAGV